MQAAHARPESVEWGLLADRIALAVAVVIGVPTFLLYAFSSPLPERAIGALFMAAVLILARRQPGASLAVFWAGSLFIVMARPDTVPLLIQVVAGAWLAYTVTRFGARATVIVSGVSLAFGAMIAASIIGRQFFPDASYGSTFGLGGTAFTFVVVAGFLGAPWLLGLRQRAKAQVRVQQARAEDAEWQRRRAIEAQRHAVIEEQRMSRVAAAEAANARLARDVHDVVGHSLAVILMQAESAQYLTNTQDLHESMNNIASCARRSLGEIREVLQAARGEHPPVPAPPGGLGALLDSVRASGVDLEVTQLGQGRALPPDAETVAYRVLQEMLTNAIKHGEHGQPIAVALTWADRLTMEVRNIDGGHTLSRALHGGGIPGMTARLQAVGGSFELNRHPGEDGDVVTATAWLPLRTN
ncbi:histidine kinase [Tessaracoccus lubricantis]|uniref:histidine kinase n=1 Tax=Tessaracoccus lubricantis TaxID=545543 RepID=A0ABP9FJ92_9ACTN